MVKTNNRTIDLSDRKLWGEIQPRMKIEAMENSGANKDSSGGKFRGENPVANKDSSDGKFSGENPIANENSSDGNKRIKREAKEEHLSIALNGWSITTLTYGHLWACFSKKKPLTC